MDFTVGDMLIDIAIASSFIFIAKMMREKISILQKLFIPASLLAGFMGLIVGDNGFGLVHFSSQLGSYAGILIIVVFVTIGIRGFNFSKGGFKENLERIGYYYCFRNIGWAGQYTLPILLGLFVLPLFAENLNPNFGMLIPAGFQGGHGTSAALGETLTALGWADATDLAMTTATIGLLTGIFGGILLINIATKKGYTSYVKDFGELPEEMKTGIIPEEKREAIGKDTISSIALDPLAWHLAVVAVPAGIGFVLTNFISEKAGLGVPAFSVGFLIAIFFSFILKKTKIDYTIDKKVISRIGGTATDFLVFFGIASIKIPVVLKYIVPFALLMLFGILWTAFHFWVIGPRMMQKDWFEKGIYVYGYATGVTAIGLSLLRIVDPNNKSTTLDETAIVTPFESIIEIFALAFLPGFIASGKWYIGIIPLLIYGIVLFLLPIIGKFWYKGSKKAEERKNLI